MNPREIAEIPDTSTPRSLWRSLAWWLLYCAAWLGVAVLLAFVALRMLYHDGAYWLCWFNAFTRYLYLPAWVCLAWAVWQRRWVLIAAAAIVVFFHLIWLAPEVLPDRRFAESNPIGAPTNVSRNVRVMFANVHQDNFEHASLIREVKEADPDVVVFAEFHPHWLEAFAKSPLSLKYPYGGLHDSYRAPVLVLSKLPLETDQLRWVSHRAVRTVDIDLGGQTLRIIGLHAPRPVYRSQYDYNGFWDKLLPRLTAEPGPLVIVGDFNATQHSLVYRQLQDAGLRSAHEACGRGYSTTWPNRTTWIPPIRIDQAFVSPEIECERIKEGVGSGSDHKPLVLDVRVRQ